MTQLYVVSMLTYEILSTASVDAQCLNEMPTGRIYSDFHQNLSRAYSAPIHDSMYEAAVVGKVADIVTLRSK